MASKYFLVSLLIIVIVYSFTAGYINYLLWASPWSLPNEQLLQGLWVAHLTVFVFCCEILLFFLGKTLYESCKAGDDSSNNGLAVRMTDAIIGQEGYREFSSCNV
jgi:hypothetical protein